jgi:hypothetical protein
MGHDVRLVAQQHRRLNPEEGTAAHVLAEPVTLQIWFAALKAGKKVLAAVLGLVQVAVTPTLAATVTNRVKVVN